MSESKLFAPSIQRCAGCIYSQAKNWTGVENEGVCRRRKPRTTKHGSTIWPTIFLDSDWCGDFEPREVEKPAEAE